MSAAEGMLSAPSATSCACVAFSRASNARPIGAREQRVFEQFRERLAETVLGVAAETLAQASWRRCSGRTSSLPCRSRRAAGPRAGPRPAAREEGYGAACPSSLFVFIQFEFPWALGPADGRYLLRAGPGAEPERVVVLGTLGAGRARARASAAGATRAAGRARWRQRGARPATPEPAPVATTRATIIDPVSLSAESQARAWLDELDREREIACCGAMRSTASCTRTGSPRPTHTCTRCRPRRRS